ncbi:uncharacterized protein MONBRDRAFT_29475 [Monosiga brevicollis MX1]|uniref:Glycosyltransferase 61 catalytic domain-containing protein n=1 Tax=Monosiga brevicollis TaxID=81824 RepID=A9VB73_MONBE|nr:uncharacterized protein MONBRDRAFT_29475 [Monosiga brevicollis MX1]EDQ85187.1 predicted protein [Monosiga brevicollis MX1]|eukprot:XP_001750012.1 hypothetical protein [Monosiga brevicollis MX1]
MAMFRLQLLVLLALNLVAGRHSIPGPDSLDMTPSCYFYAPNTRESTALLRAMIHGPVRQCIGQIGLVSLLIPVAEESYALDLTAAHESAPLCINDNGLVRHSSGVTFDVAGGCCHQNFAPQQREAFCSSLDDGCTVLPVASPVINLAQSHGETYFHTVWDVLPRWYRLVEAHPALTARAAVVSSSRILERFLGTKHYVLNHTTVACSTRVLVAPQSLTITVQERIGLLQRHLQPNPRHWRAGLAVAPILLIVERNPQGDHHRAVANHAAMVAMLRGVFTQHRVKIFSYKEQELEMTQHLWYDADVVIAPHGAGTTNVVWMRGARAQGMRQLLIELAAPTQTGRYYHSLAAANSVDHVYYELTEDRGTWSWGNVELRQLINMADQSKREDKLADLFAAPTEAELARRADVQENGVSSSLENEAAASVEVAGAENNLLTDLQEIADVDATMDRIAAVLDAMEDSGSMLESKLLSMLAGFGEGEDGDVGGDATAAARGESVDALAQEVDGSTTELHLLLQHMAGVGMDVEALRAEITQELGANPSE